MRRWPPVLATGLACLAIGGGVLVAGRHAFTRPVPSAPVEVETDTPLDDEEYERLRSKAVWQFDAACARFGVTHDPSDGDEMRRRQAAITALDWRQAAPYRDLLREGATLFVGNLRNPSAFEIENLPITLWWKARSVCQILAEDGISADVHQVLDGMISLRRKSHTPGSEADTLFGYFSTYVMWRRDFSLSHEQAIAKMESQGKRF